MLSERVDPLVGTMLGKDYRVVEPIGFGGMAVVYLVEHQTLLKRFAAKVLSTELTANFESRARFTQEAHSASQLDHENIVNISDFGVTADQRPYFVMELLRGQTLDQRIAEGPMSLEEIVAVTVPVGRALAFAHAEGIVHRDVKPENIFLVQRSQGRFGIKVVDFGIAKTPVNNKLTKMGQTLGSPYYMSPESCRGDEVDHRADLYSFGIILYLMLCGRLPFNDDSLLKVLQLQVMQPLPPPLEANPALSPELAAILERALAKDPEDRYAAMEDLLRDLEAAVPPGADRLLIEVQSGGAGAFRATPFPSSTASQPIPRVSSQSLPRVANPTPVGGGTTRAPRRRWTIPLAVAGVLAAVAIGLAMQGGDDPRPQVVAVPAPRPVESPRPAVVVPDPQPQRHHRITSDPPGATVTLDGKPLGTTPLEFDLDSRAGTGELVLTRDGRDDVTRQIRLDTDTTLEVPMERTRLVTKQPKKPPPKKPGRVTSGSATTTKGDPTLDIRLSR